MSNSYLMGAMLDPLVNEFMSSAYKEGMLEAKIRTDEIRNNCPPRAGYVCVLDPRVKGGRYYRKHVAGEGVNALPPSRVEKALTQQELRSQKGEGIGFLGKAAIAGGLAVGGLAAIGAMANSGRSTEPVPDIPNTKKPDTSVKPKSSAYEEGKQAAFSAARERMVKPPVETINNEVFIVNPRESPDAARRKRGGNPKSSDEIQAEIDKAFDENERLKNKPSSQGNIAVSPDGAKRKRGSVARQAEAIAQKLEALKQEITSKPDNEPVPLTKTTQESPDPEVTTAKKPKEKKAPVDINSMTAREASHTVVKDGYANIPDKAGAQNIGYKSAFQLKNELVKQGVIRDGAANSRADFEALLDNNMLVEEGLLVQTKTGVGKYGKNNIDAIRVPAFMPVKDLSKAASNIYSEGKGGAGITDRVERAEALVAAITEKLNKAKGLTELERNQLVSDRNRLTDKINVDNAKIKGSVIAEVNKPMGKLKPEPPKVESVIAKKIVGADPKAIAKKMEDFNYIREVIDGVSTKDANNVADYLAGLKFAGTAHENKKTVVRGLRDKAKKIASQTPAIAEKAPEDPNTFPLGASAPQTPVVRPEPAKPNNATTSSKSPSIPKPPSIEAIATASTQSIQESNQVSAKPVLTALQKSQKRREAYIKRLDKVVAGEWVKDPSSEERYNSNARKSTKDKDANLFITIEKEDDGYMVYTEEHDPDELATMFRGKNQDRTRFFTLEEAKKVADEFGEYYESLVQENKSRYPEDYSEADNPKPKTRKSSKKQTQKTSNNDAIASHETYHSAREQAKLEALRRFAA